MALCRVREACVVFLQLPSSPKWSQKEKNQNTSSFAMKTESGFLPPLSNSTAWQQRRLQTPWSFLQAIVTPSGKTSSQSSSSMILPITLMQLLLHLRGQLQSFITFVLLLTPHELAASAHASISDFSTSHKNSSFFSV